MLRFTQIASQLLIAVECYTQFKTLDEMKALLKGKLKETGIPDFMAGLFIMGMSKLERWKKNNMGVRALKKETNEK